MLSCSRWMLFQMFVLMHLFLMIFGLFLCSTSCCVFWLDILKFPVDLDLIFDSSLVSLLL